MKVKVKGYTIETRFSESAHQPSVGRDKSQDAVVASYKNSWGEIDASLPMLVELKRIRNDFRIVAIIESTMMMSQDSIVPVLFDRLKKVSDVLVYPALDAAQTARISEKGKAGSIKKKIYVSHIKRQLRAAVRNILKMTLIPWWLYRYLQGEMIEREWSLFFKHLVNPRDVKIILEDHTKLTSLQRLLRDKCRNARIILYPHATSLYISNYVGKTPKIKKSADAILLSSDLAIQWARDKFPGVSQCEVVGFARYDKWWMETVFKDRAFLDLRKRISENVKNMIFAFFTHDTDPAFLPYEDFEYLVRSACDVVFSYRNGFLLIKPHPRQDVRTIVKMMGAYPEGRWLITNMQALQVSIMSDFVIAMTSSTILDALAVEMPVVEFFNHRHNPRAIINNEGKYLSEYGFMNLSIFAETKGELQHFVGDYFSESPGFIWAEQRKRAMEILKLDNLSSHRAANFICKLASRRD